MKVYRVKSDVSAFQYFLPEREADIRTLRMECTERLPDWNPPPVFIFKPFHKRGDFFHFSSNMLITSPASTNILRGYLEEAGELLPLPYKGEEYTLLNVLNCIDCLDEDKTEWFVDEEDGTRLRPLTYAFHPDRFTEARLFKIPQTYRAELLVADFEQDDDEEFLGTVRKHGLQGLIFEQLWEG